MKYFMLCRRTFVAITAIAVLAGLSVFSGFDPSMAIASVAMGVAGSNAVEKGWTAQAGSRYRTSEE